VQRYLNERKVPQMFLFAGTRASVTREIIRGRSAAT
jgi:hypothetical protein